MPSNLCSLKKFYQHKIGEMKRGKITRKIRSLGLKQKKKRLGITKKTEKGTGQGNNIIDKWQQNA
ncbi:hypothetical protein C922_04545 [Plasmodium inui San Antonio 1]|uniref:Uncharacterized protein n=1 Tax=Plasmodium inui San Antonio 1 TaxID=1237626 RepID=W7A7H0_9APIC|nr:hypothetical protein C922_04545 [Plasmodium inui San Antonio 1]EUD65034.1 hypothetical protein C922_04545 [Plasmodium inui San Antonio 1]